MMRNMNILEKLEGEMKIKKVNLVDIGGNITYSLVVGGLLDFFAGLNPIGIITSRAYATGVNFITGGPYGRWSV